MNIIILDGSKMTNKNEAHLYLKEKLNFPDYYGENLDALWDMLSSISEAIVIELINEYYLTKFLGYYGQAIIQVFADAEMENPNITLKR